LKAIIIYIMTDEKLGFFCRVNLCANFVKLRQTNEGAVGLFEYHVFFDPHVESKRLRYAILRNSHEEIGKTMNFDGAKLYLPVKLEELVCFERFV
jgi:hypothetical protein